jgi:hypothetical protein
VLRQAKMSRELQELNRLLAKKEELAKAMNRSEEEMTSIRNHYEVSISISIKSRHAKKIIFLLSYMS